MVVDIRPLLVESAQLTVKARLMHQSHEQDMLVNI